MYVCYDKLSKKIVGESNHFYVESSSPVANYHRAEEGAKHLG